MRNKILKTINTVKKLIGEKYLFNEILKNEINFNKCYLSLDIIEDTQEAISYYEENEFKNEIGYKYLIIYGLLEALYLQQQAIIDFTKSLGLKNINIKEEYKNIYEIREIRNDIAGHPTYREKKNYSTYLSRYDLQKDCIQHQKNLKETIKFNIKKGIIEQEKWIFNILEKCCEDLKKT